MNIGIITDSIRKNATGIGIFTKELIKNLRKLDKKNDYVLIDYHKPIIDSSTFIIVKNYFIYFKTYLWHNILPLAVKNINMDYIMNASGCPHLIPFIQKEILFIYDLSWLIYPKTHPISRVFLYRLFMGKTIRNCYKIVTISENTKKDIIKYYRVPEEKIIIIYPQISLYRNRELKPKMVSNDPYLLYLGTLEPRKNISFLIEAFKKVKDDLKIPHKLIIAGKKGWGFKEIFDMVHKFNLEKDVIFTDYVSEAEKKYLYKHADIFIYPSLYEGFGIPPLEAMNYGCPVITSNVSSLPEVMGGAGILVNPNKICDLINSIKKVLTDQKIKNKMIKDNLLLTNKFCKAWSTEQLRQLINITSIV